METTKSKVQAFSITGDWSEQSKKLKKEFSQLTDTDLKFESGKENDLLKRLQSRLHKNREEIISIIKKAQPSKN